jgi:hypothetical protein
MKRYVNIYCDGESERYLGQNHELRIQAEQCPLDKEYKQETVRLLSKEEEEEYEYFKGLVQRSFNETD